MDTDSEVIGEILDWADIQDNMWEALPNARPDYLTEIYNNVFLLKAEYLGDETWKIPLEDEPVELNEFAELIYEFLPKMQIEYVTEIHNNICFYIIKYLGNNKWEIIGEQ